jgi:hypothetical protein
LSGDAFFRAWRVSTKADRQSSRDGEQGLGLHGRVHFEDMR